MHFVLEPGESQSGRCEEEIFSIIILGGGQDTVGDELTIAAVATTDITIILITISTVTTIVKLDATVT